MNYGSTSSYAIARINTRATRMCLRRTTNGRKPRGTPCGNPAGARLWFHDLAFGVNDQLLRSPAFLAANPSGTPLNTGAELIR